ncbi:MAG: tetratricopeptide repeat protein [Bdellovibrionaceae bacterium]|nr:tetratricopeptide repeat protein [Bdellovibrio sp.]
MKKNILKGCLIHILAFVSFLGWHSNADAATKRNQKTVVSTTRKQSPANSKIYTATKSTLQRSQLANALGLMKSGQYPQAANSFLSLSRRSDLASERSQIKYYLGLCMMEMSLNQAAAFQFVDVIKSSDKRWTRQAIEKLLIVTDRLGDETLLNYAIQRIDVNQVPTQYRDMLYFRLAEIKHKAGLFTEAVNLYNKVGSQSRFYYSALYGKGLAQAEGKQPDLALASFKQLLDMRSSARVTDVNKVAAQLSIARTYYQKQNWEKAIEAYSAIPRDSFMWHEALFEKTWAMLRAARFRSTLSNFQTLHSTFYEDAYIPETLLLRSIVYLYICKYDEMEKVVDLFDTQYGPISKKINAYLNQNHSSENYFQEVNKAFIVKKDAESNKSFSIPYNAIKHIAEEGDVRRTYSYLKKLNEERKLVDENPNLRATPMGVYASGIITNRLKSARSIIGEMVKAHLLNMRVELKDLNEQASFIRYEMINGKKETLKKRINGKTMAEETDSENQDRAFYIKNGYEYYPFQGEYWLDEVGNYHYLGKQSCE